MLFSCQPVRLYSQTTKWSSTDFLSLLYFKGIFVLPGSILIALPQQSSMEESKEKRTNHYITSWLPISPGSFYFIKLLLSGTLHSYQGGNAQESLLPVRIPSAFTVLPVYIISTSSTLTGVLKDLQYPMQCKSSPGMTVVLRLPIQ